MNQSMTELGNKGAIFIGYNVAKGDAMGTLKNVPKDQKLETAKTFLEEKYREGQLKKENINQLTLPLSFAKIARMYGSAQENGFASYAEG